MKRRTHGFTLMELLVVLAIAAVILGIGAPNFNAFRLNGRLTNSANDVLATLVNARTDAIKTQVTVSMCPSANPSEDDAVCTDDATEGWIAFRDTNGDCERVNTEAIVSSGAFDHSFGAQPLHVKMNGDCVSFGPNGFTRTVAGKVQLSHFLICDDRGIAAIGGSTLSAGRGVIVERTGRSRTSRTISGGLADDLSTWNTLTGVTLTCP